MTAELITVPGISTTVTQSCEPPISEQSANYTKRESSPVRSVLIGRGFSLVPLPNHLLLILHPNGVGLLVLDSSHPILTSPGKVEKVDFQPGGLKSRDYAAVTVGGKHKRGAPQLQPDTKLCKVTLTNQDTTTYTGTANSANQQPAATATQDVTNQDKTTNAVTQDSINQGKPEATVPHYSTNQQSATTVAVPECVMVRAGLRCKILEVNSRLKDNPNLLKTQTRDSGYLAVVNGIYLPKPQVKNGEGGEKMEVA